MTGKRQDPPPPAPTCTAPCDPHCDRPQYAFGLCVAHYRRMTRGTGRLDTPIRRRGIDPLPERHCCIPGCTRTPESFGMCGAHYLRWRTGGEIMGEIAFQRNEVGVCSVAGCSRTAKARGRCHAHYMEWYRRRRER